MKSFNQKTKEKYIERAINHRKADEIIKGAYYEDGKGCCVGCLSHANKNSHKALEEQTGIPEWLSRVADTIHEELEDGLYQKWPERFVSAVPENMKHDDFQRKVRAPFMVYILKSTLRNFDHKEFSQVKKAVDGSIKLWRRDDIGSKEWSAASFSAMSAARDAASDAAWYTASFAASDAARSAASFAARDAARSAAWSTASFAASDAASFAASFAASDAASFSAMSAASDAARSAAYKRYANQLIKIMKEA